MVSGERKMKLTTVGLSAQTTQPLRASKLQEKFQTAIPLHQQSRNKCRRKPRKASVHHFAHVHGQRTQKPPNQDAVFRRAIKSQSDVRTAGTSRVPSTAPSSSVRKPAWDKRGLTDYAAAPQAPGHIPTPTKTAQFLCFPKACMQLRVLAATTTSNRCVGMEFSGKQRKRAPRYL